MFSDMYAAYDALSEPIKKLISGLSATHELSIYTGAVMPIEAWMTQLFSQQVHPIVGTHLKREKALFVTVLSQRKLMDCQLMKVIAS